MVGALIDPKGGEIADPGRVSPLLDRVGRYSLNSKVDPGNQEVQAAPEEDWEPPESPADRVAFGVEFKDGRRATRAEPLGAPAGDFSFRAYYEEKDVAPDPADNAILHFINGGGSSDSIAENMFVWPLPRGGLRLFGSWSDAAMGESFVELRAETIVDALARARRVFET